jgi:hypothetical protein
MLVLEIIVVTFLEEVKPDWIDNKNHAATKQVKVVKIHSIVVIQSFPFKKEAI